MEIVFSWEYELKIALADSVIDVLTSTNKESFRVWSTAMQVNKGYYIPHIIIIVFAIIIVVDSIDKLQSG